MITGNSPRTGYAPVRGLDVYFEIRGEGRPLVLLHRGLDTIATCFGQVLRLFAEGRQVVVAELQGHGHTAEADRQLR